MRQDSVVIAAMALLTREGVDERTLDGVQDGIRAANRGRQMQGYEANSTQIAYTCRRMAFCGCRYRARRSSSTDATTPSPHSYLLVHH